MVERTMLNSAPYQVFIWQHSKRNEMEKDGGLTEINNLPVNYKPVLCKTEQGKKSLFFLNFSVNLRKIKWKRLYESKSILSSHLTMSAFCVCSKNNCHRISKILTLFILNGVKGNIFRSHPQSSKVDFWFICYSFETLIEPGNNWLLEAL